MSLAIGLEQAPNPDSRVTLGERVDALGQRVARLDWRLGKAEIETARRFVETVVGEMERLGLASVDVGAFSLSDDPEDLSGVVVDIGHHMGTTRMATDPARGVVDANCTVHGVQNLHVASCSVFPTSGVSNPTFTMLALSVRLADHLALALKAPG
jgi:choline dehydrogenase-like flavoprotein